MALVSYSDHKRAGTTGGAASVRASSAVGLDLLLLPTGAAFFFGHPPERKWSAAVVEFICTGKEAGEKEGKEKADSVDVCESVRLSNARRPP